MNVLMMRNLTNKVTASGRLWSAIKSECVQTAVTLGRREAVLPNRTP
jgi:hypothetical protein